MLLRYAFSNFQSFRERVEVDLTVNKKVSSTAWMAATSSGARVSKLMAAIGPNASGKTTLLKPAAFMAWFAASSFQNPPEADIPLVPHFSTKNEPSTFECEVDFDGKLWRYELTCTQQQVLYEALFLKRERFNYVFTRSWNPSSGDYDVKQQDFGLMPKEARKVRPNASLISTAAQYGVPMAAKLASIVVVTNVMFLGRLSLNQNSLIIAAEHFAQNRRQALLMNKLLSSWDLGLTGVELMQLEIINNTQDSTKKVWVPHGKHKSYDIEESLPFFMESSGTQGAFVLLYRLLQVLEKGGLAIIDEFENDLHPHMLGPILDLFANSDTNPHQAQLIFTCHAIEVLNLLHKSQVMLVQKDEECQSNACRLDKISGVRNDDNYYSKYMAGAYGAVPDL
jgi:hypothetical protein